MKTLLICALCISGGFAYAQPSNFNDALELYLDLNNKRDFVVWETMIFINEVGERNESICDYSDYINIQIEILEYYTEAIIDVLENGNRQDISKETEQETQMLVSDRRQRNSLLTSLLRTLVQDCMM